MITNAYYSFGRFRLDVSERRSSATEALERFPAAPDGGESRSTAAGSDTCSSENWTSEETYSAGSGDDVDVDCNLKEQRAENQVYDCPECDRSGKEVDRFLHLRRAHGFARYSLPVSPRGMA